MDKGDFLTTLLRSRKTVFSFKEIALLWNEPGTSRAHVRINYYVRQDKLYPLRRGLYAKDKNYNRLELATKIFVPSYVSFETVLVQAGINFQFYKKIFAASYLTREILVDGQPFAFRKIKDAVLTDSIGIENKNECCVAEKERALLDTLYLHKEYHFDNLSGLDWNRIFEILPIYKNKRMEKRVEMLYKESGPDR